MLYKQVKKLWAQFLASEFGTFWLVPPQPKKLWTNRGNRQIQHVRKVQERPQLPGSMFIGGVVQGGEQSLGEIFY